MSKKHVLILDDSDKWIKTLTKIIERDGQFEVTSVHDSSEWDEKISASSYWNVIIVDIKLCDKHNGSELASRTIYDHGIMSPIIIISSNINLNESKKIYKNMFFRYVDKDYVEETLLDEIHNISDLNARKLHIKNMLKMFCRKFRILNNVVPLEQIDDEELSNYFDSSDGTTFMDLIDLLYGTGSELDKCGKKIMDVIRRYHGEFTTID